MRKLKAISILTIPDNSTAKLSEFIKLLLLFLSTSFIFSVFSVKNSTFNTAAFFLLGSAIITMFLYQNLRPDCLLNTLPFSPKKRVQYLYIDFLKISVYFLLFLFIVHSIASLFDIEFIRYGGGNWSQFLLGLLSVYFIVFCFFPLIFIKNIKSYIIGIIISTLSCLISNFLILQVFSLFFKLNGFQHYIVMWRQAEMIPNAINQIYLIFIFACLRITLALAISYKISTKLIRR